jgi:hypothetical protein
MTGFAHALIERTRASRPAIRPRLASRFAGSLPPVTGVGAAPATPLEPRPRRQQSGFDARRLVPEHQAVELDLVLSPVQAPSQHPDRPGGNRSVSAPVLPFETPHHEIDPTAPAKTSQPGVREASRPQRATPAVEDTLVERDAAAALPAHRARPADLLQPAKDHGAKPLVDAGYAHAVHAPHIRRPDPHQHAESLAPQPGEDENGETEIWRDQVEARLLDLFERIRELTFQTQSSHPESAIIPLTGSVESIVRSSGDLCAPSPSQSAGRTNEDGSLTRADGTITAPRPRDQVSDGYSTRNHVERRQAVRSDADTASTINVTIGRIEVRAAVPRRESGNTSTARPGLSLESYLRQRNGGVR